MLFKEIGGLGLGGVLFCLGELWQETKDIITVAAVKKTAGRGLNEFKYLNM
jgi:hypothetical protein